MTIRPDLAPIFLRLRHGLLALLCLALLAGFFFHRPSWHLGGAVLLAIGVAQLQLRYFRLAMVTALAPLPGLIWFAPIYYPFAFALAALMASGLEARLLRGSTEQDAFAALFDPASCAVGAVVVALGWSLWGQAHPDALLFAILSVLLAVPVGAIFLPFGEDFHIAANRAREAREPWTLRAAQLAQPRWAFALSGITLVFLVLGVFGRQGWPPMLDGIGCALVAGVFFAATLDWRAAVAGLVSAGLLLLYGLGMTASLLLFVALALFLAGRQARGREAWAQAIEDRAAPVFFAGLGASLIAAMLGGLREGLMALGALAAALCVFPALTALQHLLLPRRFSVEELYRDEAR